MNENIVPFEVWVETQPTVVEAYDLSDEQCPDCDGEGEVWVEGYVEDEDTYEICEGCKGSGLLKHNPRALYKKQRELDTSTLKKYKERMGLT